MEKNSPPVQIKGYEQKRYSDLQKELNGFFKDSKRTLISIAAELDLKSQMSVSNALSIHVQLVSDQLLARVMNSLKFPAIVLYVNGEKLYFVKENISKIQVRSSKKSVAA